MRIAFGNEIKSYICYICEIVGEDAFSGGPLKTYIFYANSFFRVYGKNLKTNHVYNLMIHMFCLECFSLRWIINELFLKVGAAPKFKDFNKQWIVVSLKFSEFWYVRCMNTRSQSEIYRRGNVENGWKSLIMVDHAWKCQWSKKILSWL